MFSYYYKDCTSDLSFLTTDDITTCIKHSTKENFRCFEWEHNPTRTRMITITKLDGRASIVSGDWHV